MTSSVMATKSGTEVLERLLLLLSKTGFASACQTTPGGVVYKYGPVGTLLRQNILQRWWQWHVVGQENTFPVENGCVGEHEVAGDKEHNGTLNHFGHIAGLMGQTLPFSIVKVEKGKQSKMAAGIDSFLFDSANSTNLKLHHFTPPASSIQSFDSWLRDRLKWWRQFAGTANNFSTCDMESGENQLLSSSVVFKSPWGDVTVETVSNKGDSDLLELEKQGVQCKFQRGKKTVVPHMIECQTSLETAAMVFLTDAFTENVKIAKNGSSEKDGTVVNIYDDSMVMNLHPVLAPYKVAIASGGKRESEAAEVASHISKELREAGVQIFSSTGGLTSLSKQIIRNDVLGIPFTMIVDDKTLELGSVGLRSRDTTIREYIPISRITDQVLKYIR